MILLCILASSVNIFIQIPCSILSSVSFIYTWNIINADTDPCGTPPVTSFLHECVLPNIVRVWGGRGERSVVTKVTNFPFAVCFLEDLGGEAMGVEEEGVGVWKVGEEALRGCPDDMLTANTTENVTSYICTEDGWNVTDPCVAGKSGESGSIKYPRFVQFSPYSSCRIQAFLRHVHLKSFRQRANLISFIAVQVTSPPSSCCFRPFHCNAFFNPYHVNPSHAILTSILHS